MTFLSDQIAEALGPAMDSDIIVRESSPAEMSSYFAVSDLAVASIRAAAVELGGLTRANAITIDRRLTLMWFGMTLRPIGWAIPPSWDSIAGDYLCADGWIKLHTNTPRHRQAVLATLRCSASKASVGNVVRGWQKSELEAAVHQAGGAAAAMLSLKEWADHPQGKAVVHEPLISWTQSGAGCPPISLKELRVLDLTRVLAGPVATRFLAGFGADVMRIDPPDWNEPGVEPEVTIGKRRAGLDLTRADDRRVFEALLGEADVIVHGYRPGALARLGYGERALRQFAPMLTEVMLDAYGWTGPWAGRRGFDSLVQMSCGIADEGMRQSGSERPVPLPVQALDHATGYLVAATVLRALRLRCDTGDVFTAKISLARTAALLVSAGCTQPHEYLPPETEADLLVETEHTDWGPALRLRFPVTLDGQGAHWAYPAGFLRRDPARWA